jgi:hypothetical protein
MNWNPNLAFLEWNRGNWNTFDADDVQELSDMIRDYGPAAERAIDSVLHDEGAQEIKEKIARLLPKSGRTWRGKPRAAARAMPRAFDQDDEMLAVTVAARDRYHYLYFPDDGSNTERHRGGQEFMRRGAERATERIIELCMGRLLGN